MTDEMVLATQQWLNKTYTGKYGYNRIAENGNTGWSTIYALTRALQIEMGINEPSDNFGNQTRRKYNADPIRQPKDERSTSNKFAILQGALWCKGYDSRHYGKLDDHYDLSVARAITVLQKNAGIGGDGTYVNADLMKALLSMDQFRLIPGTIGSAAMRGFQQHLNSRYGHYVGIVPCDGIYSRTTNEAAIYMLQASENMPASVANGNFGPSTRSTVPTIPYTGKQTDYYGKAYSNDAIAEFTYLLAVCLYANGFGDGNFSRPSYQIEVSQFQQSVALPITGTANLTTWLSLLISCGDTDRKGIACDTRFEINQAHLKTLIANGYQYIGRYLTGGDFKEIREDELDRIINGGLEIFPIFEEGYTLDYFTAAQGKSDAKTASDAAHKFRIPNGEVIYFAVDFDALDSDVTSNILPYFKALKGSMSSYRIGIYAPRNVCSRIAKAGYSSSSFVADMSSGFSGNMGYKIPTNWAFDQISNVIISHNGDSLEIDNDLISTNICTVNKLNNSPVPHQQIPHAPIADVKVNDNDPVPGIRTPFNAFVNKWTSAIPVFETAGGGTPIAYIQPNESYISRVATETTLDVYTSNNQGSWTQGTCIIKYIHDGLHDKDEPWLSQQKPFVDWNARGASLVPSTRNTDNTPDHDDADRRTFTLRYPAYWRASNSNGIATETIAQGVQVAIPNGIIAGNHYPLYIECDYWRSSPNGAWHQFEINGVIVPAAYIEFGFEYGCMPENRLFQ